MNGVIKGPCQRCGEEDYNLSTSGPDYCPACAMGNDMERIKQLREENEMLRKWGN